MDIENNLEDNFQAQQLNEYINQELIHWEPVSNIKDDSWATEREKLIWMKQFNSREK